jgi:hypothetical protein
VQTIPDQISQARAAFAEAPDERARMGRISGVLWILAATIETLMRSADDRTLRIKRNDPRREPSVGV